MFLRAELRAISFLSKSRFNLLSGFGCYRSRGCLINRSCSFIQRHHISSQFLQILILELRFKGMRQGAF